MSADAATWVVVGALAVFGAALTAGCVLMTRETPLPHAFRAASGLRFSDRDCAAPKQPLTVAQAHRAMQQHLGCLLTECPRKHAAWQVLVEAGHARPDTGRVRA